MVKDAKEMIKINPRYYIEETIAAPLL